MKYPAQIVNVVRINKGKSFFNFTIDKSHSIIERKNFLTDLIFVKTTDNNITTVITNQKIYTTLSSIKNKKLSSKKDSTITSY